MTTAARTASFHLTRYPRSQRGAAASRMWFDRPELREVRGLGFWRLLGTARGRSMNLSADLDRWAMFAVWQEPEALQEFLHDSATARRWREVGAETCTVRLRYLSGHGSWDGRFPFGDDPADGPGDDSARASGRTPMAVLTRAAIRPTRLLAFYRATPSVDRLLPHQPGLLRSVGVGEWPLARQATFSIWSDPGSMLRFAYRSQEHRSVVERTRSEKWYREEMFCRFAVTGTDGSWDSTPVLHPSQG